MITEDHKKARKVNNSFSCSHKKISLGITITTATTTATNLCAINMSAFFKLCKKCIVALVKVESNKKKAWTSLNSAKTCYPKQTQVQ